MQFFSNNDCIGVCSRTDNCMTQEIEIRNQAANFYQCMKIYFFGKLFFSKYLHHCFSPHSSHFGLRATHTYRP